VDREQGHSLQAQGSLRHSPACPENPQRTEAASGNRCPGQAGAWRQAR